MENQNSKPIDFYLNWIPTCFNVIGCEYSTDIDIIIPVPNQEIITNYKNKKFNLDLNLVKTDLVDLGYDITNKDLDVNLVYLEPKTSNIIDSLIGEPKLTQNIIYHTYHLHPQAYPPIVPNQVQIDLSNFVRLFSKIVLDWMEKLLGKMRYKDLRPIKVQVYRDLVSRLDFSLQILQEANYVDLFQSTPDIIKSLGMKLGQIVLLYNDSLEYTKKNISLQINKILPSIEYDAFLFVLSRGKLTHIENLNVIKNIFNILITQYERIIQEIKTSYDMVDIGFDLDAYISTLTNNSADFAIREFCKSPEKPSPELGEWINAKYHQAQSLNAIFEIETIGCDVLPQTMLAHIHMCNQRSTEWLDLLKFYSCGNSTNNVIEFIDCETNYNLIRGCLGEKLLVDLVDWDKIVGSPVSKCICGLLVETKGVKDSKGIAPDLLLITDSSLVIPVEIKTIVSEPNIVNRKFLREMNLASKQLDTSIQLIEKITNNKTFGLMVFCFIHSNQISIKYKKYQI